MIVLCLLPANAASPNIGYFDRWRQQLGYMLEVLQNWLDKFAQDHCPIRVREMPLAARKVFFYAGKTRVTQGVNILFDLAKQLRSRIDVRFLFVGCGSDSTFLKVSAKDQKFDEVNLDKISDVYSRCGASIVATDSKHKSHNILGKFLTYMQSGLSVLVNVNAGNNLTEMICGEQVCESNKRDELKQLFDSSRKTYRDYKNKCYLIGFRVNLMRKLEKRYFR